MENPVTPLSQLSILVGVLFAQCLASIQVAAPRDGIQPLDPCMAVGTIAPFEKGIVWLQNGTGNLCIGKSICAESVRRIVI